MEGQHTKQQNKVTQSGCAKGHSNDRFKVLASTTKSIASFTGKPSNPVERSKSLLQYKNKGIFKRIEEMTAESLMNQLKNKKLSENKQSTIQKQSIHSNSKIDQYSQKQKEQQEHVVVMQLDQQSIPQASKKSIQNSSQQGILESQEQQENKLNSDKFQTPVKKSKQIINKNSTMNNQHDFEQYYFHGSSSSSSYQKQKRLISTGILSPCLKDNQDDKSILTNKVKMQECQINSQDTTSPQSLYYPTQTKQTVTRALHTPSKQLSVSKHIHQQQNEKEKQQQIELHQKQLQQQKENNQQQQQQQQQQQSKFYQYSPIPPTSAPASASKVKKFSRSVSQEQLQQSNGQKTDQQHEQQHKSIHHRRNLSDSMNFILLNKQSAPYSMKTKVDDRFLLFKKAVEYNLQIAQSDPSGKQDLDMIFEKSMLNTQQKNIGSYDQASIYSRAKFKSTYLQS